MSDSEASELASTATVEHRASGDHLHKSSNGLIDA